MLFDNFLRTQNVVSLGTGGKLLGQQDMKSLPSSPGAAGAINLKNRTRQLQLNGPMVNNKNRRLTNSVSSANIPELQKQNCMTPQACYNTVKQQATERK